MNFKHSYPSPYKILTDNSTLYLKYPLAGLTCYLRFPNSDPHPLDESYPLGWVNEKTKMQFTQ